MISKQGGYLMQKIIKIKGMPVLILGLLGYIIAIGLIILEFIVG